MQRRPLKQRLLFLWIFWVDANDAGAIMQEYTTWTIRRSIMKLRDLMSVISVNEIIELRMPDDDPEEYPITLWYGYAKNVNKAYFVNEVLLVETSIDEDDDGEDRSVICILLEYMD